MHATQAPRQIHPALIAPTIPPASDMLATACATPTVAQGVVHEPFRAGADYQLPAVLLLCAENEVTHSGVLSGMMRTRSYARKSCVITRQPHMES